MPIRIDYTPTPALLNLARAAGEAERRQRTGAEDIAFTQMILGTQAQYAQIGLSAQARDRAFDLQQAEAAARIARTPMTRAGLRSPVAEHIARKKYDVAQEEVQQKQVVEQLEAMHLQGIISKAELERGRLGAMGGRPALYQDIFKKGKSPIIEATKRIEKRNQRHIERQITVEERQLKIDPYVDPTQENIRVEKVKVKIKGLEDQLKASYQREDAALGMGTIRQPTSTEENALMDKLLAETGGDVAAAKRLWTERGGE